MAENAESSSDAQLTFKVKTSSDKAHTITISETATVLDLKNKLAGEDFENIPVDRQRLIYSGRVLKNDDTLATYKIKTNNTVHMVKSAASNPSQPPASSASPAPPAVPTNMASGTANNPLAGLTGARYAGHQINLPGMDMFGPDGGMGPPMDEERLQRMMEDPNVQQSMNEALNNPDFINMLIQSNPMLRNLPNAREIITSPFMRQMMSNPAMMTQAMRMQRNVRGTNSAFPAPGATDTTTGEGQATGDNAGANAGANAAPNPEDPFAGAPRPQDFSTLSSELQALMNAFPTNPAGQSATAGANPAQGDGQQQRSQTQSPSTTEANANPFAALFGGGMPAPPPGFQADPAALQNILQMLGGGGGGEPAAPADNRPPEERYATQLRQLNDMGFFDFDRNVAALRRSGGNVQGAVEYLLGPTD